MAHEEDGQVLLGDGGGLWRDGAGGAGHGGGDDGEEGGGGGDWVHVGLGGRLCRYVTLVLV